MSASYCCTQYRCAGTEHASPLPIVDQNDGGSLFGSATSAALSSLDPLISYINYKSHKVFILSVLSHADYTKGRWKNVCGCD